MIVLDTDLISLMQRGHSPATERLLEMHNRARMHEPVQTTVITYEEQIRGWFKVLSEARTVADLISAYERLRLHAEYYGTHKLIDFDDAAAVEFQRLRGLKIRISTSDLKIAAITLARQATLWTRNLRDFKQVPGLSVTDPTT
jgi:tRNA(fMet)-specific endonuclease VapC